VWIFSSAFQTYQTCFVRSHSHSGCPGYDGDEPLGGNKDQKGTIVEIDKKKIKTLDEMDEPAPIDQVEERVEAKMKRIEGKAKERVASGLNDKELAKKGQIMKEEGEKDLEKIRNESD
jgi:hypothetical protein